MTGRFQYCRSGDWTGLNLRAIESYIAELEMEEMVEPNSSLSLISIRINQPDVSSVLLEVCSTCLKR